MPFTTEQFFQVFVRYNYTVGMAPWVLLFLAIFAVALVLYPRVRSDRPVSVILALLWLWSGAIYHMGFFAEINKLAYGFAVLFIVQSALILEAGVVQRLLSFQPRTGLKLAVGALLILYAMAIYPIIGYLSGHRYPAMPTFGTPCPTTIFTLGLFVWTSRRPPWRVMIVPLVWAIVGSVAAIQLAVPQDYGLAIAGLLAALLVGRTSPRRMAGPEHGLIG